MNRSILFFSLIGILYFFAACNGDEKPNSNVIKHKACSLKVSENQVSAGDKVEITITKTDQNKVIDHLSFALGDLLLSVENDSTLIPEIPLGRYRLSADVVFEDSTTCTVSKGLEVYSNIKPDRYSYQIVNTYEHDPKAYTQGLLFYNNEFFEATGQWGYSDIRHYEIPNPKPEVEVKLSKDYFGEGITILNNKIYQLTYQSNICFVYDLKTFEKIGEMPYDGEGWGLTDNGVNLIMSNGSNQLHYLDTNDFSIVKTLYVYRGQEAQHNLNELEYVNGKIFANIYQSDEMIEIDPETGSILAVVDFKGILDKSKVRSRVDVFNGIAYSKASGTFFVTGKWWPTLFEVRLLKS